MRPSRFLPRSTIVATSATPTRERAVARMPRRSQPTSLQTLSTKPWYSRVSATGTAPWTLSNAWLCLGLCDSAGP